MKHIKKPSVIAVLLAVFGTSAAFADDQQLQGRLAVQRAQARGSQRAGAVAVYAVKGLAHSRTQAATIVFPGPSRVSGLTGGKAHPRRWVEISRNHFELRRSSF